jgi:uncharacterized protein YrrD
VLLKKEKALVGVVEDMVINPDDGKLAGILVREGFGKKHLRALPEKDLLSITSEYYLISSYESLGDIDDIVRIKQIVDREIKIAGNKVFTVSGIYLGKCRDMSINLKTLRLDKIYVRPTLFSGILKEYVISFAQIVSIEKDKITVEDAFVKAPKPVEGRLSELELPQT